MTLGCLLSWSAFATDAPAAGELTACVSDDNAPFSSSGSGGIDVDIAAEIALRLGRTSRIAWVAIPNRGGLGKALRDSIGAGRCELFLGVAVGDGPNEDLVAQHLTASAPYMTATYVLVAAKGGTVRSVEDARRAARVGVVSATPADLYLYRSGHRRLPFAGNPALLAALAAGAVDAGLVWSPALASARAQGFALWPDAILPAALDDPSLHAGFVVATRQPDTALATQVDAALAQMRADGFVQTVLTRHGMAEPNIGR
jgi:ABC-type amino acid transport substrate-binding protein